MIALCAGIQYTAGPFRLGLTGLPASRLLALAMSVRLGKWEEKRPQQTVQTELGRLRSGRLPDARTCPGRPHSLGCDPARWRGGLAGARHGQPHICRRADSSSPLRRRRGANDMLMLLPASAARPRRAGKVGVGARGRGGACPGGKPRPDAAACLAR